MNAESVYEFGPTVGWVAATLLVLIVAGWIAYSAGQSPLLALLTLLPVAGWLVFAVVVITRRSKASRAEKMARWAKEEGSE